MRGALTRVNGRVSFTPGVTIRNGKVYGAGGGKSKG